MLTYTENTRPLPAGRKDGATTVREITICDDGKKVGRMEIMAKPDGTAVKKLRQVCKTRLRAVLR